MFEDDENKEYDLPESTIEELGDELYEHFRLEVDKGQALIRIDKFLLDRLQQISRNKIQNAIRANSVLVNGSPVKPNYKIKPLDLITIVLPHIPDENSPVEAEPIPLDIIYEDEDVLVINKPAGLVVHPGIGNKTGTLVNALAYYFRYTLPIKEGNRSDRPGLVHRIDKDTSGLLVIAKNDFSMTHLANQFFEHTVTREYIALVWGEVDPSAGRIEGNLARNPNNRMQMMVFEDADIGKPAITNYETHESFYYTSLVKCQLETGRTHQIRAHMMYLGHPLFGDARYGGDKILKGTIYSKYKSFIDNCYKIFKRQALHARTLGFTHPTTGERMYFECPIPDDFKKLIDKWRKYIHSRKEMDIN